MIRTLEVFFHRLPQILFILVLPPIVGLAVAYFLPPSYQTTATLWALRRYEVIGSTGPESDLQASPADTQVTAISELLQSRTFALAIANQTPQFASTLNLGASVLADPQRLDDALYNELSHQVQVTSLGYNLLAITYTSVNPVVAQHVVAAVIQNYGIQSQAFSVDEAQRLLDSYNTQYTKAKLARDAAVAAETKYVNSHPGLIAPGKDSLQSDPQYNLLHNQTLQAQSALDNLNTVIATINEQINTRGSGPDSLFKVVDNPVVATHPQSRVKVFSLAAGIGLGVAILGCALYLVILVRRDHGIYNALDLQKMTTVSVIVQLPALTPKFVPFFIDQPLH